MKQKRSQKNKIRVRRSSRKQRKNFQERFILAREQFLAHMRSLAKRYSREAVLSEEDTLRKEAIRSMSNYQRHQWQKSIVRGETQALKDVQYFTTMVHHKQ